MKHSHITTEAGTLAVRFISTYRDVSDYGVTLCASRFPEVRISVSSGLIVPSVFADRFMLEHGFTFETASNAVRAFMAENFDRDVREIVRMGILEFADPGVSARAVELGLIPAAI